MNINVKYGESLTLADLVAGDVFMFADDDDKDIYMMTDNDYIDHDVVYDDELVVVGLDNGHLYSFEKNKRVTKAHIAEFNVEM